MRVVDTCIVIGFALQAGADPAHQSACDVGRGDRLALLLRRMVSRWLQVSGSHRTGHRRGARWGAVAQLRSRAAAWCGKLGRAGALLGAWNGGDLARSPAPNAARARASPHRRASGGARTFRSELGRRSRAGIECEGRALGRGFRARIYGGPHDLARGDRVEIIADLAPVQLFRNEDLDDPRPGGARRGVMASGGAHDVRITERGTGSRRSSTAFAPTFAAAS